jgi:CHASE2 domain-containing sensor protein
MNHPNDRLLAVWTLIVGFVLAPLAMLSVLLVWPPVVQIALTALLLVAGFGPRLTRTRTHRRR